MGRGPDRYGIFGADANNDIREQENSDIGQYSIYNILNVVIKFVWHRYVMEEGYLTNFIPNIIVPNSKHFAYYQLNTGLPSVGQITWLHHFKLLGQVFFSALKKQF